MNETMKQYVARVAKEQRAMLASAGQRDPEAVLAGRDMARREWLSAVRGMADRRESIPFTVAVSYYRECGTGADRDLRAASNYGAIRRIWDRPLVRSLLG